LAFIVRRSYPAALFEVAKVPPLPHLLAGGEHRLGYLINFMFMSMLLPLVPVIVALPGLNLAGARRDRGRLVVPLARQYHRPTRRLVAGLAGGGNDLAVDLHRPPLTASVPGATPLRAGRFRKSRLRISEPGLSNPGHPHLHLGAGPAMGRGVR